MNSDKKIENILDAGVSKEALWEEISRWLPEHMLNEFLDDFIRINDIDIEED